MLAIASLFVCDLFFILFLFYSVRDSKIKDIWKNWKHILTPVRSFKDTTSTIKGHSDSGCDGMQPEHVGSRCPGPETLPSASAGSSSPPTLKTLVWTHGDGGLLLTSEP